MFECYIEVAQFVIVKSQCPQVRQVFDAAVKRLYAVVMEIKLLESEASVESGYCFQVVIIQPKYFKVHEQIEVDELLDASMGQVQFESTLGTLSIFHRYHIVRITFDKLFLQA